MCRAGHGEPDTLQTARTQGQVWAQKQRQDDCWREETLVLSSGRKAAGCTGSASMASPQLGRSWSLSQVTTRLYREPCLRWCGQVLPPPLGPEVCTAAIAAGRKACFPGSHRKLPGLRPRLRIPTKCREKQPAPGAHTSLSVRAPPADGHQRLPRGTWPGRWAAARLGR